MKNSDKIAIFEWVEIRKTIYNDEWWFVIVDVVKLLTDSKDPSWYIKDMRRRDEILSEGWGQIATPLEIDTAWWKQRVNCSNTEGILRIIQSIPSPRAEPFKRWLAQVWNERIQEIENPELAMNRMIENYEKKWYPKEWIDIRTRWIPVRKWLTNEWDERWWEKWYWILTNEVYKAYAGMNNTQWKESKWMKKSHNLRDGMTPTELILTMLAEQATTDITKSRDIKWMVSLKKASKDGGWVAYKARQELIEQTWDDPISNENYLDRVKDKKKLK